MAILAPPHSSADPPSPSGPVRAWEWAAVAAGLLGFFLQSSLSSLGKAPVGDAWTHYAVGEWALGRDLHPDEPAIWEGTMPLCALNVLFSSFRETLNPLLGPPTDPFEAPFRYNWPSIFWARLPVMGMGVILLLLLWRFARTRHGPKTALCVLGVAALEPNLIGYSRFVASDFPATLGFFAGLVAIIVYCERPSWPRLALLAVVLALAQITKSTMLFLYGAAGAAAAFCHLRDLAAARIPDRRRRALARIRRRRGARAALGAAARIARQLPWKAILPPVLGRTTLVGAACFAAFILVLQVTYAGFAPERVALLSSEPEIERVRYFCKPLYYMRNIIPIPYSQSLAVARYHNIVGHPAWFMGQWSRHGWAAYFPAAILLKTPLPILLLAGLGFVLRLRSRRDRAFWILTLAAAGFLAVFCLFVTVNIGVRYVLPLYPVIVLFAGVGLARLIPDSPWAGGRTRLRALLAAALALWTVVETARIAPHYAEYFNQLAGGPYRAWNCLADSNIEWGQDVFLIKRWAEKQERPVHLWVNGRMRGLIALRTSLLIGHTPEMQAAHNWLRQEYQPLMFLSPGAVVYDVPYSTLLPSGEIDIGAPSDTRFLGEGWHERETWDDSTVRWARREACVEFRAPDADRFHLTIDLYAPASPELDARTVDIRMNKALAATARFAPGDHRMEFTWTPPSPERSIRLTLTSPDPLPRHPDDPRALSFAVDRLVVRPAQ